MKRLVVSAVCLTLICFAATTLARPLRVASEAETVVVASGPLKLRALLWRPPGHGPFPAVLFNHGSYSTGDAISVDEAGALGSVFARHGYVFLFLFRQGIGLSKGQGTPDGELMSRAFAAHGLDGRNRVQLELLEGEELEEARAGLAFLRRLPDVDARRIAVSGHSFGGSLSLVLTARDARIRAAVLFGAAAASWGQSPVLRARLRAAAIGSAAPIMFIHAANDYSIAPGQVLADAMRRAGKPYVLKIYPAAGTTAREGHNLLYRIVDTWESDVFGFLAANMRG